MREIVYEDVCEYLFSLSSAEARLSLVSQFIDFYGGKISSWYVSPFYDLMYFCIKSIFCCLALPLLYDQHLVCLSIFATGIHTHIHLKIWFSCMRLKNMWTNDGLYRVFRCFLNFLFGPVHFHLLWNIYDRIRVCLGLENV